MAEATKPDAAARMRDSLSTAAVYAAAVAVSSVALLTSCGGSGGTPAAAPSAPVHTERAPDRAVAASEPAPLPAMNDSFPELNGDQPQVPDGMPRTMAWREVWREDWADLSLGGRLSADDPGPECNNPNPDAAFAGPSFGARWYPLNFHRSLSASGGLLTVDEVQGTGQGHALLAHQSFDRRQALRLSATVHLQQSRGAWLGLALMQASSHYREIALMWGDDGALHVGAWSPCRVTLFGTVRPGPVDLAIEWRPAEGWRYLAGGVVVGSEAVTEPGAALTGAVRPGLYFVNLYAESIRGADGRERATVGPVTVQLGESQ